MKASSLLGIVLLLASASCKETAARKNGCEPPIQCPSRSHVDCMPRVGERNDAPPETDLCRCPEAAFAACPGLQLAY